VHIHIYASMHIHVSYIYIYIYTYTYNIKSLPPYTHTFALPAEHAFSCARARLCATIATTAHVGMSQRRAGVLSVCRCVRVCVLGVSESIHSSSTLAIDSAPEKKRSGVPNNRPEIMGWLRVVGSFKL